ncbi:MAG TPA: hypothetical protein VKK81_18980 [Candidatus Binatia bacterium]|nr:hypothetical protein [Candidatus Binatia bacterium]
MLFAPNAVASTTQYDRTAGPNSVGAGWAAAVQVIAAHPIRAPVKALLLGAHLLPLESVDAPGRSSLPSSVDSRLPRSTSRTSVLAVGADPVDDAAGNGQPVVVAGTTFDLAPMDGKLVAASPGQANPMLDAVDLADVAENRHK